MKAPANTLSRFQRPASAVALTISGLLAIAWALNAGAIPQLVNAANAEQLVKSRKNVVIMNSTDVPKSNFYSSYDFSNAPGKIVNASEEFYSQLDRSKQKDAVMFMTNDKQTILISSYGLKGENGKENPGDLNWVHAMDVASDGTLYFGDVQGRRAQKFVPVGMPSRN